MFLDNFEQVLASEEPVLVDFWAPWCGPCKRMVPVMDKLAVNYPVFKVNTDEEIDLAASYSIGALPTFLVFKKGQIVAKGVGVKQESDLRKALEDAKARNDV